MPRWVIHSTISMTRATHCVMLNRDLLLVLTDEMHRKVVCSVILWVTSNLFSLDLPVSTEFLITCWEVLRQYPQPPASWPTWKDCRKQRPPQLDSFREQYILISYRFTHIEYWSTLRKQANLWYLSIELQLYVRIDSVKIILSSFFKTIFLITFSSYMYLTVFCR